MALYDIEYNSCLNETQKLCSFRLINGLFLTLMSLAGLIVCIWVIYNLVFCVMILQGSQNLFLLNVLFHDTVVAIIGIIRGLGILDKKFMGVDSDGKGNVFCHVFSLVAHIFWNNPLEVLTPLTIDRFMAITMPLKHRKWMHPKLIYLLIVLFWSPAFLIVFYHLGQYRMGLAKMSYQPEYHRCTLNHESTALLETIVFYFIPTALLILLYTAMVVKIVRHKIPCKKLLLTSAAIGVTGVLVVIPQILLYMNVKLGYKDAQFWTVTMFYISPLCDSLLYYFTNPAVLAKLPRSGVGRAAAWISEGVSVGFRSQISPSSTSEVRPSPRCQSRPSTISLVCQNRPSPITQCRPSPSSQFRPSPSPGNVQHARKTSKFNLSPNLGAKN